AADLLAQLDALRIELLDAGGDRHPPVRPHLVVDPGGGKDALPDLRGGRLPKRGGGPPPHPHTPPPPAQRPPPPPRGPPPPPPPRGGLLPGGADVEAEPSRMTVDEVGDDDRRRSRQPVGRGRFDEHEFDAVLPGAGEEVAQRARAEADAGAVDPPASLLGGLA